MTEDPTHQDSNTIELVSFGQEDAPSAATDSEEELLDGSQKSSPISVLKQKLSRQFTKTSTVHSSEEENTVALRKELTVFSGVGFVVGQNIGSAIFITPSHILSLTGSFGVSFILWLVGAGVALSGALCYIELGLLVRKSGAEYAYLLEAYSFKRKNRWCELLGSLLAFLYSWSAVFYFRAASLAVISLACARYLTRPFFTDCDDVPDSIVRLLAMCVLSELV